MTSPSKRKIDLKGLINAFNYSIKYFKETFKKESILHQEFFLSIILITAGFLIGESNIQKTLLISSIIILLFIELLNSKIETTVEKILIKNHPLAKRAKDIGNIALFLAIGNAFITWILILYF